MNIPNVNMKKSCEPCTNVYDISDIEQLDGAASLDNSSISSNDSNRTASSDNTEFDTDDEIDPATDTISITPPAKMNKRNANILKASTLPLNARARFIKCDRCDSKKTYCQHIVNIHSLLKHAKGATHFSELHIKMYAGCPIIVYREPILSKIEDFLETHFRQNRDQFPSK